jgi:hypothetical protein
VLSAHRCVCIIVEMCDIQRLNQRAGRRAWTSDFPFERLAEAMTVTACNLKAKIAIATPDG